jgi:hypothetical protein
VIVKNSITEKWGSPAEYILGDAKEEYVKKWPQEFKKIQ